MQTKNNALLQLWKKCHIAQQTEFIMWGGLKTNLQYMAMHKHPTTVKYPTNMVKTYDS